MLGYGAGMSTALAELVAYARRQPWAVEATVAASGAPQAAVIGVVVTDRLELFFDTDAGARKAANLRRDPRVAFVVGWDEGQTLQLEGVADEPAGDELETLLALYRARFPDADARAAGRPIAYFRVRPTWARYTDFRRGVPDVVELSGPALG